MLIDLHTERLYASAESLTRSLDLMTARAEAFRRDMDAMSRHFNAAGLQIEAISTVPELFAGTDTITIR